MSATAACSNSLKPAAFAPEQSSVSSNATTTRLSPYPPPPATSPSAAPPLTASGSPPPANRHPSKSVILSEAEGDPLHLCGTTGLAGRFYSDGLALGLFG